jgi:L-asparaginase
VIALLFTGGTISMRIDPQSGAAVPALDAGDILDTVPTIGRVAPIAVDDFTRLPGPHITPAHMWALAERLAMWLARPDCDGVVVTHGTDTIEETAFFLDVVLDSDKPVVLVGAMRTISDPSWDGPGNLLAAARTAASPASRQRGVLVVMDDQILAAREVRKVHTEASASFATPEFGPLGVVDAGHVIYRRAAQVRSDWRAPDAPAGLKVARIDPRVELVQVYTGMTDLFIRAVINSGARGLALVAFGRGNVPPAIMPALTEAVSQGLMVTASTRCVAGRVRPRYGYEGGGLRLEQAGVLLAGDLSGAKARLLQMVALAQPDPAGVWRRVLGDSTAAPST